MAPGIGRFPAEALRVGADADAVAGAGPELLLEAGAPADPDVPAVAGADLVEAASAGAAEISGAGIVVAPAGSALDDPALEDSVLDD